MHTNTNTSKAYKQKLKLYHKCNELAKWEHARNCENNPHFYYIAFRTVAEVDKVNNPVANVTGIINFDWVRYVTKDNNWGEREVVLGAN